MENLISCEEQSETPDNWFSNFSRRHFASCLLVRFVNCNSANLQLDDKLGPLLEFLRRAVAPCLCGAWLLTCGAFGLSVGPGVAEGDG